MIICYVSTALSFSALSLYVLSLHFQLSYTESDSVVTGAKNTKAYHACNDQEGMCTNLNIFGVFESRVDVDDSWPASYPSEAAELAYREYRYTLRDYRNALSRESSAGHEYYEWLSVWQWSLGWLVGYFIVRWLALWVWAGRETK